MPNAASSYKIVTVTLAELLLNSISPQLSPASVSGSHHGATRAFSTPFAIPSCRRIGSAISGATERAADSYSDYLTGAAIPLAAPSGKRMYDHPGAVGLTGSPAHYFGAARKWGVNLRSSGVRARRLLLSQAPAWLGRLQAHHLGSARRTSSRRLGVPPAFRGKFPVPGCSCRPPREKRPRRCVQS